MKKYKSKIFLIFLFCCLFVLLRVNFCLADLEVKYPALKGAGGTLPPNPTLPAYVLYLFDLGMFVGFFAVFISLIIAGATYLISPADPKAELLSSAKDRVVGAISGLLILVLTYLIITTINPQLSFLTMNSVPSATPPPPATQAPGVYFYKDSGCSDSTAQPNTSDVPDLGALKNKVNSVGIVQDSEDEDGSGFLSILYDAVNFQGKCLELDPNQSCQSADDPQSGGAFAASASVFKYDPSPSGDGVYFYRKSCFEQSGDIETTIGYCNQNSGGYLKVSNNQIENKYKEYLNKLQFTGDNSSGDCKVPEEEQNCVKYDKNGVCTQRSCPALDGENISSIIINGDYIVLLVYKGQGDNDSGPWTYCQAFPTVDDVNKIGPQQIKWENIRNHVGALPNYMVIFPVQK